MKFAVVFALMAFASTASGKKAELPTCYPLDQPSGQPGQKQPDIDCEKCRFEAVIQQALTGKAAYIPQCNAKTNKFLPKQVDAATGFSWCSTPYGVEIPNTKTKKKGLICKKKVPKGHNCLARVATKGFKAKCAGKNYRKVQCLANGYCWCSMKDGSFVPNTIHKSSPGIKGKSAEVSKACGRHTGLKFKCGKRLGNVKHPFDLTRYIKCGAGGKTYSCSCPANTIYNVKKRNCVINKNPNFTPAKFSPLFILPMLVLG